MKSVPGHSSTPQWDSWVKTGCYADGLEVGKQLFPHHTTHTKTHMHQLVIVRAESLSGNKFTGTSVQDAVISTYCVGGFILLTSDDKCSMQKCCFLIVKFYVCQHVIIFRYFFKQY